MRRPKRPVPEDIKIRERVVRQPFTADAVPEDLDAIVIGSGIGGLSTAALLARAGKRVLVLEQHEIAGGCTHTFRHRGFKFSTGIHYVGGMQSDNLRKYFLDQISDGQIIWAPLEEKYDIIQLGTKRDSEHACPPRTVHLPFHDPSHSRSCASAYDPSHPPLVCFAIR